MAVTSTNDTAEDDAVTINRRDDERREKAEHDARQTRHNQAYGIND